MKIIILTGAIFCLFVNQSYADPIFKVTKIDCIPEIKYFVLHSDVLVGDEFDQSYENILEDKYSLFYGDFSYDCKIGTRNIKIFTNGLNNKSDKFSKTGEPAGGFISIFIDEKLVYKDDDFINYENVLNKSETYKFSFLSSAKFSDYVGIQHCLKDNCVWIKNDALDDINNFNK